MSATSKPFQAATVRAATAALTGKLNGGQTGANQRRRFLVADEVGLGKTLVARDTLAALAAQADRFTVYYITSGLKVADQNKVELLRFLDKAAAKDALSRVDRIGLIPFEDNAKGKLRLYAFTPLTSFSTTKRLYGGKAVERAFIQLLLGEIAPDLPLAFPAGFIEQGAKSGWPWACAQAQDRLGTVGAAFKTAYETALGAEFGLPITDTILQAIAGGKHGPVIGRLRKALAQAALASAPPDLVIFDEFQCYRELLEAQADNPLARQLLEGTDDAAPPPILLLSATPYRLYAERWEQGTGKTPHVEFFDIIDFLGGKQIRAQAEAQFQAFGDLLHLIARLPAESRAPAIAKAKALKQGLEDLLAPFMSRTERPVIRQTKQADMPAAAPRIAPQDIAVFRHFADHVSPKLAGSAIVYWLSVPLPAQALGERYQISRDVNFPATQGVARLSLKHWHKLPTEAWGSSKLRALNTLVPTEALALPWVLPSLPWWAPAGPWSKVTQSPKILVFSHFRATPQSLAALVSLEVERKYLGKPNHAYADAWKKRHLTPTFNQGPILALFSPSPFLIKAVDPLNMQGKTTLKALRTQARKQIVSALPPSIAAKAPDARGKARRKPVWAVLGAIERAAGVQAGRAGWRELAKSDAVLQDLLRQRDQAEDITFVSEAELDALVDMALGAPGVVAGRALLRHLPKLFDHKDHMTNLIRFCWSRLRPYLDRPVFWVTAR